MKISLHYVDKEIVLKGEGKKHIIKLLSDTEYHLTCNKKTYAIVYGNGKAQIKDKRYLKSFFKLSDKDNKFSQEEIDLRLAVIVGKIRKALDSLVHDGGE